MYGVLAGSYAPASTAGIRRFRLDLSRGELSAAGERDGVAFPAYLARSATTRQYYTVSETTTQPTAGPGTSAAQTSQPGMVWSLGPDPAAPGGTARALATGGELPTHIAVHPSGRWLAVANYGAHPCPGSISIVRLDSGGSLAEVTQRQEHTGSGPVAQRQGGAHVHATVFSAAGDRLVAADLGADALVSYDFDARAGQLRLVATTATPPGWGPRYLLWGPAGLTLLVVGELACELGVFAVRPGGLELIRRVPTLRGRADGVLAADLHASPDGRRVYVSNRGQVNSIATFDVTTPDQPVLIGETASGGVWPRHLAVAPDGRCLVVANEHSGRLTALAVDADGRAGAPVATAAMPAVSYVEFTAVAA